MKMGPTKGKLVDFSELQVVDFDELKLNMPILLITQGRLRSRRPCFVHCSVMYSQAVEFKIKGKIGPTKGKIGPTKGKIGILIGNPIKSIKIYRKPIKIYGEWLEMVGNRLGYPTSVLRSGGHSWQGPFCFLTCPF